MSNRMTEKWWWHEPKLPQKRKKVKQCSIRMRSNLWRTQSASCAKPHLKDWLHCWWWLRSRLVRWLQLWLPPATSISIIMGKPTRCRQPAAGRRTSWTRQRLNIQRLKLGLWTTSPVPRTKHQSIWPLRVLMRRRFWRTMSVIRYSPTMAKTWKMCWKRWAWPSV